MFAKMIKWFSTRTADKMERESKTDMTLMREINKGTGSNVLKFGLFSSLSQHRQVIPTAPWFIARIASAQVLDCGPCTQIVVNYALLSKVSPQVVEACLNGGAELDGDNLLAHRYGKAMAENDPEIVELAEQVRTRWGDEGLVEMALNVASSQVFPVAKRGLGLAVSCSKVRVAPELIDMTDGAYHPPHYHPA